MREMWAAEAEHPVFAGSLHNFKLILDTEPSKPGTPPKRNRKSSAVVR